MSDDRQDERSGGGFDDWLDDDLGPVTDPYKALASDDGDEDIAEWMEFAGGQDTGGQDTADELSPAEAEIGDRGQRTADSGQETGGELLSSDRTGEVAAVDPATTEGAEFSGDETGEVESATPDLTDEADDTGELDIALEDTGEATLNRPLEPDGATESTDEVALGEDSTDEMEDVRTVGLDRLWERDEDATTGSVSSGTAPEVFDISQEGYALTATREHADLAESVSLAHDEETQQVALAAPIPGLDATVVGFEDVVEAEGHRRVRSRGSGDLVARLVTGFMLVAALSASLLWRPAFVALVLVVFVLGAGEFYTALVRSGRKPIALFGFLGIIGASLGAFFFGALSIPAAFLLATTVLLLFYAVVPHRVDPLGNLALTIVVMVWAGLGSFVMLIARSESYRVLIFAIVVVVVAMDIAQYFFGRAIGKHRLAPWVSPQKTVEGLCAGVVVALIVGALLHFLQPFDLTSGLVIGAVVAIFSPIGDLAMSAAKRSLGLKDMGSVLPGHGGFLDRIDGLIFVIPVAWATFLWAGIL